MLTPKTQKGGRLQGRCKNPIVDVQSYSRVVDAGGLPEPMKCARAGTVESPRDLDMAVDEASSTYFLNHSSSQTNNGSHLFELDFYAPNRQGADD